MKQDAPLWTEPPKTVDIPKEQVLGFRNAAKSIAEFALQGRGQALHVTHRRPIPKLARFTSLEDNIEAYNWNTEDVVLFELAEDDRHKLIQQVLETAYKSRESRKSGEVLDVLAPDNWPQRARQYFDELRTGPLLQFEKWVGTLPDVLQAQAKSLYDVDLWMALEDIGQRLLIDNPMRKYVVHEMGDVPQTAERIVTPLLYSLAVLSSPSAVTSLRSERGIFRKIGDYVAEKTPFVHRPRIEHMGVGEQYQKASGLIQSWRARRAEKKKKQYDAPYRVTLGDAAMWSLSDEAFRGESLDAIIQPMRTMFKYTENAQDEYKILARGIAENARRAGMTLQVDNSLLGQDQQERSARLNTLSHAQKKMNASWKKLDADKMKELRDSYALATKVLTMIHEHDIAAHKFDSLVTKLTKPRTQGDSIDEGLLYLHDGKHLAGFESRMNKPDTAGIIFDLTYHNKDKAYDLVTTVGAPVLGTVGLADRAQLERASKYLEGPQNDVIRSNPTGKLMQIVVWEGGMWAAKKLKRNLRDKQMYYNSLDAIRQIAVQGFTDPAGLITDAMKESKIPDNPKKVVTEISKTTAHALSRLRLPYESVNEAQLWRSAATLSLNDAVREEDSVAFQAALGAINVRRKHWTDAEYFLGMAENWSKFAEEKEKHHPQWRIFAHYNRSAMYGERRMFVEQAKELFEAYMLAEQSMKIPMPANLTTAREIGEHVVQYPMQYRDRLTYLSALQHDAPAQVRAIADGTIAELQAILSIGDQYDKDKVPDKQFMTAHRREKLEGYIAKYERLSSKRPIPTRSTAGSSLETKVTSVEGAPSTTQEVRDTYVAPAGLSQPSVAQHAPAPPQPRRVEASPLGSAPDVTQQGYQGTIPAAVRSWAADEFKGYRPGEVNTANALYADYSKKIS